MLHFDNAFRPIVLLNARPVRATLSIFSTWELRKRISPAAIASK
jgi:hypothetical protein